MKLKYFTIVFLATTITINAQTSVLPAADSLYAVGEYAEAIEKLEKVSPKSEAIYLKLAKFQAARGNTSAAIENYRIVLEKDPERVLTAIEYAKVLMKANRFSEADSLFAVLAEKYPSNANFVFQQGLLKEKLEDSTAIELFKNTIQLNPAHIDALYKLAKYELKNGEYNMAVNYSLMGLGADRDNSSLLSILGQAYYRQDKYKLAAPALEKIIGQGKGNEFVYTILGLSYYRLTEFDKAIKQFNKALEIEDRNSSTHYNLGKIYAITGDLEKSEMHLLMAILIKKQPVDAEFLSLGLTYKLQKDHKKALEYFNRSLEENPQNERALYERAIAADNYFKDLSTKINYYQAYLSQYETTGNEDMLYLAKTRMSDLRKELHLAGE